MNIKRIIKNLISPILIIIAKQYLRKERYYSYEGIRIKVSPGVFHPGLFFSTKILLKYLSDYALSGKKVLELGAGSGLISIYAAKKNSIVTAADISKASVQDLYSNSRNNNVSINIIQSDLFDEIPESNYDLIIINPPYFPKNPINDSEYAWFCGEDFQYFKKLFCQLEQFRNKNTEIIMILSEDCALEKIRRIAEENKMKLILVSRFKNWFEDNFIYSIK